MPGPKGALGAGPRGLAGVGRGLGIEGVGRGLGDWRAWGRGLGEWRAGGGASGPVAPGLWCPRAGARERPLLSAGVRSPDGRSSPCPRPSCLQPKPSAFHPSRELLGGREGLGRLVPGVCRVCRVWPAVPWPTAEPRALRPRPARCLEAGPAGCPQLQSWAASHEPPSGKGNRPTQRVGREAGA